MAYTTLEVRLHSTAVSVKGRTEIVRYTSSANVSVNATVNTIALYYYLPLNLQNGHQGVSGTAWYTCVSVSAVVAIPRLELIVRASCCNTSVTPSPLQIYRQHYPCTLSLWENRHERSHMTTRKSYCTAYVQIWSKRPGWLHQQCQLRGLLLAVI